MIEDLLQFLTLSEGLDYLQRNGIYWIVGLAGIPLLLLLNREFEKQKAEGRRQQAQHRYKRAPVVHPPKSSTQQQRKEIDRQRQVKANRLDEYKKRYLSSPSLPVPPGHLTQNCDPPPNTSPSLPVPPAPPVPPSAKQQKNTANRQRQVTPNRLNQYNQRYPNNPAPTPTPKRVPIVGVKSASANRLQPKLISLLNGDRKTAERLLQAARLRHPEQSEQWLFEKVIHDLQRDRQ